MTSQGRSSIVPQTGSLNTFGKPPRASPASSRLRTGDNHFFARFSTAGLIEGQRSAMVFTSSSRRIGLPLLEDNRRLDCLSFKSKRARLRRFDCRRPLVVFFHYVVSNCFQASTPGTRLFGSNTKIA